MSFKLKSFAFGLSLLLTACSSSCSRDKTASAPAEDPMRPDYSGISVERVLPTDVELGKGKKVVLQPGAKVTGVYTLYVYDPKKLANKGPQLASSEGKPYTFTVGKGEVIRGWEEGIIGMQEGGKRNIVIPASLAYKEEGTEKIPGGTIVLLEFELLEYKAP